MSKWKAPVWMVPGAKVRVFKGRMVPIGVIGTIVEVYGTGNGAKASITPAPDSPVPCHCYVGNTREVWISNLEPAN